MTAPLNSTPDAKTIPMSPIRTSGRAGNLIQADYEANVLLVRDNITERVRMLQALAAVQFGERTALIIANNNNIPTPPGFTYIGTNFGQNGFVLEWKHAVYVATLLASGVSVKVDLKGMTDNEVSLFMATLFREFSIQSLSNVVTVIDNVEKVMPRKLNGRDGAVVGEFRNSFAEAFREDNILIAGAKALDATVLEVSDVTDTFVVGRMGKPDVVAANTPFIHRDLIRYREYREFEENGMIGIGVSVMPDDDHWLFNLATANVRAGGPFYIDSSFYQGYNTGQPININNQTELCQQDDIDAMVEIAKTLDNDSVPIACAKYLPKSTAAKVKHNAVRRGKISRQDPTGRRAANKAHRGYQQNSYAGKSHNIGAVEAQNRLVGETNVVTKIAIATGYMTKMHYEVTADSLVNFIVGNTLLEEATRAACAAASTAKLMSGKAFGIGYYEALLKNPAEARQYFGAMCSARHKEGLIGEVKKHLANLRAISKTPNQAAPTALRILNKGWRRFLANGGNTTASNDNKAEAAAA